MIQYDDLSHDIARSVVPTQTWFWVLRVPQVLDMINTVTMRENRFILRIRVMMVSAFLVSCSCLMKLSPAGATVRQDQQVCSQAFRPCNGGCVRVAQREFHFGAKRKIASTYGPYLNPCGWIAPGLMVHGPGAGKRLSKAIRNYPCSVQVAGSRICVSIRWVITDNHAVRFACSLASGRSLQSCTMQDETSV